MHRPEGSSIATRVVGAVLTAILLIAITASPALAQDPSASTAPGGDPRSPGRGPGLVGDPLVAVAIVLAIAIVAVLVTLAYVRLTSRPAERSHRGTDERARPITRR
jgi:hypothetical protein